MSAVLRISDTSFANVFRASSVKLIYGAARDSRILTKNIEAATGVAKAAGEQAHHIVGGAYQEGKLATDILKAHNIDINSPLNGVYLPGCGSRGLGIATAIHCGKHSRAYERYVLTLLQEAGGANAAKVDIINALSRAREDLLTGQVFLNSVR